MPAPPEEQQAQQQVSTRRKVTFACDTCRKRRAKCSGTQPCAYCAEKNKECRFDQQNRARRGPKPRKPANQLSRPPRVLAIMPSKSIEETDSESANSPRVTAGSSEHIAESYEESDDGEDVEDEGENHGPSIYTWLSSLEGILHDDANGAKTDGKSTLGLISHLLELYWNHGSAHLQFILPPGELIERIQAKSIPSSIIYAACACIVRFSTHKAASEPSAYDVGKKLAKHAREKSILLDQPTQRMDRLLTHCCLAEFEFNCGNGSNAWIDLAVSRSLLQIIKSGQYLDSEESKSIQKVEYFLSLMEAFYSIGTPSISGVVDHLALSSPLEMNGLIHDDDPAHLTSLIYTLLRIQQLFNTPLTQQTPPPWSADSAFKCFRDELQRYLIHWPNIYGFTATFQEESDKASCSPKRMCALIWHCCSILLDRSFLPIPYRTATGDNPNVEAVAFPQAPTLFLRDRVRRCEASAMAIPLICKEVIYHGEFFRYLPWLGYSCMQSALVLINQSRHSSHTRDFMAENMKLDLAILLMTRNFFQPACNWVDTLSHIQNDHTIIRDAANRQETAFEGFYGRFEGISEPSFIALERNRTQRDPSRFPKHGAKTRGQPLSILQPFVKTDRARWTDSYVGFLETENSVDQKPIIADQSTLSFEDPRSLPPQTMMNELSGITLGTDPAGFAVNLDSSSMGNASNFDAGKGPVGNAAEESGESSFFAEQGAVNYETEMWFEALNQIMGSDETWVDMLAHNTT